MRSLPVRRASVLAVALLASSVGLALADTVPADGNAVLSGNQALIPLGTRAPGEVVTRDVAFTLACGGLSHPAPGATITVQASSFTVPLDGGLAATSTTIGPVPATWPAGGEGCPSPAPTLAANGPSSVTLTMPTTPGNFVFTVMYARLGGSGLSGLTAISFEAEVVANTPPTISVPESLSVEATSAAGATVAFDVVTGDAEDDSAPAAVCTPSSGDVFPLGSTTVSCTVTDSGGLFASVSFDVTVEDGTAPALAGLAAGLTLTTGDPAGAVLDYPLPTASDAVDPDPTVSCTPAPGSVAPVGDSSVTCTATDDAGKASSVSFPVSVTFVQPAAWSAVWGEPVGGSPAMLVANHGRNVPVKVEILANGVELEAGPATIRLDACGGGTVATLPLSWGSGRWSVNLDTTPLAPGCYDVVATHDGRDAGSFRLDIRGSETLKAPSSDVAAAPTVGPETATKPEKPEKPAKPEKADKANGKGPKK